MLIIIKLLLRYKMNTRLTISRPTITILLILYIILLALQPLGKNLIKLNTQIEHTSTYNTLTQNNQNSFPADPNPDQINTPHHTMKLLRYIVFSTSLLFAACIFAYIFTACKKTISIYTIIDEFIWHNQHPYHRISARAPPSSFII